MAALFTTLRGITPALLYFGGIFLGCYLIVGGLFAITAAGEAILSLLSGVVVAGVCFALAALTEAASSHLDSR